MINGIHLLCLLIFRGLLFLAVSLVAVVHVFFFLSFSHVCNHTLVQDIQEVARSCVAMSV